MQNRAEMQPELPQFDQLPKRTKSRRKARPRKSKLEAEPVGVTQLEFNISGSGRLVPSIDRDSTISDAGLEPILSATQGIIYVDPKGESLKPRWRKKGDRKIVEMARVKDELPKRRKSRLTPFQEVMRYKKALADLADGGGKCRVEYVDGGVEICEIDSKSVRVSTVGDTSGDIVKTAYLGKVELPELSESARRLKWKLDNDERERGCQAEMPQEEIKPQEKEKAEESKYELGYYIQTDKICCQGPNVFEDRIVLKEGKKKSTIKVFRHCSSCNTNSERNVVVDNRRLNLKTAPRYVKVR